MCVSQVHTDWHVCMGYIHSNDCDQWVQVSYFIPRLSEIHICRYIVYISLYLVPDIYTTAWQAKKRCVFQYKQTKTWRASKEDSKCLTQHENSRKTLYLCISRRIIGLLTSDIFMKGSVPVTLPCIFDILLIKGVLTLRYDNQRINVKYIWYFFFIQKQINGIFYVRYFVLFFSLHLSDYLIDDMKCIQI